MKHLVLFAALLLPAATLAQSPSLDPNFQQTLLYEHTMAQGALQLSDGSRVVMGNFQRAEGRDVNEQITSLVRYLPSGVPNTTFNTALANQNFGASLIAEAGNGKLLVYGGVANTTGSELLRLNADGTRDATFTARPPAPPTSGYGAVLLVQADGKIIIGGAPTGILGLSPAPWLTRLNADGTLDASFTATLTGVAQASQLSSVVQQADGKLLVAAYVQPTAGGTGQSQVFRLLPTGAQDVTFQVISTSGQLNGLAVQPDGKVLVAATGFATRLIRLSASGVPDASFAPAPDAGVGTRIFSPLPQMAVQADGRILIANTIPLRTGYGQAPVARLLPSGAYDPTWNVDNSANYSTFGATSVQLLANGQVLIADELPSGRSLPSGWEPGAALLGTNGQRQTSFQPRLYYAGRVSDVAQQPDGRLVAVGTFAEVNGTQTRGVVRFHLNGQVDTAFSRRARLHGGQATRVLALANGQLVISGNFAGAGGAAGAGVARLLPTGQADAAFGSALLGSVGTNQVTNVTVLAVQPDGKLLVGGSSLLSSGGSQVNFMRLNTDGAHDATFQPALTTTPTALLVQPNGTIVVGRGGPQPLQRLLPNGVIDQAFTAPVLTFTGGGPVGINSLARYPDGRLLIGGRFTHADGVATTHVARLLPNGFTDATFTTQTLSANGILRSLTLQPNGRILLAGTAQFSPTATAPALFRVLPDGAIDPSFDSSRGPVMGSQYLGVSRVIVQADGALVAAGGFSSVQGLPVLGLTRLLDPNVLRATAAVAAADFAVWPVPAREALHLQLAPSVGPCRVRLLTALGQPVRTLPAATGRTQLPTADLARGLYLLRVEAATGAVSTRRVVLE